jgi:hypothetical protein
MARASNRDLLPTFGSRAGSRLLRLRTQRGNPRTQPRNNVLKDHT